ncbi:MAG: hypothetical protein JJV90_00195, partial [Spiroplasma sp.]|nr:hypothetical protein [Mycoplasmatales bacterium]
MENTTDREYLLKEEKVKTAILAMIIPSIVAGGINMLNIIIDTYFLGNFAADSLNSQAATATSMSMVLLMNGFCFMLAIGTAVLVSKMLGENKKEKISQYMANSFVAGWVIYIMLLVVFLPLLPTIVEILTGASGDNPFYVNSLVYMKIMIIGFPTLIFTQLSSQTIRAEGQANLIVRLSIVQVIINSIINFVLISDTFPMISFHGGPYEAAGAAIATVLSQGYMTIMLMRVLFNKNKTNFLIELPKLKFEKAWFAVFRNGFPQFLASVFFAIGIMIISISAVNLSHELGRVGDEAAILSNASGITVKLVMMVFLLINGAIQGIQGFFSYQYGARQFDRLIEGLKYVRVLALGTGITLFFVFFFFSTQIAGIFTSDIVVIELVDLSLKALGITCLLFPTAHMYFGLFAALGKPRLAMLCTIIRDFILLSGCAYLIPKYFGESGLMITMQFSLLVG